MWRSWFVINEPIKSTCAAKVHVYNLTLWTRLTWCCLFFFSFFSASNLMLLLPIYMTRKFSRSVSCHSFDRNDPVYGARPDEPPMINLSSHNIATSSNLTLNPNYVGPQLVMQNLALPWWQGFGQFWGHGNSISLDQMIPIFAYKYRETFETPTPWLSCFQVGSKVWTVPCIGMVRPFLKEVLLHNQGKKAHGLP